MTKKATTPTTPPNPDRLVEVRVGDVVNIHKGLHLAIKVTDSGATCVKHGTKYVAYETTGGKQVEFDTFDSRHAHISATIPFNQIVERGADVTPYLAKSKLLGIREQPKTTTETTMTNTKQKLASPLKPIKQPRGGLAADAQLEKQAVNTKTGAGTSEKKYPRNDYDRYCWEQIEAGGTVEEIAERVAKHFKGDKKKHRAEPATFIRYVADYVKEMKAAGFDVKSPEPKPGAETKPETKPKAKAKSAKPPKDTAEIERVKKEQAKEKYLANPKNDPAKFEEYYALRKAK